MVMKVEQLEKRIISTIEGLGCELWGIQILSQGKRSLLRVYVDKAGGANLGDCQKISSQLLALFKVDPPLAGIYTLEVSTPGLDRILFHGFQYESQLGKKIQVRLRVPKEGHRQFQGKLLAVDMTQQGIDLALPGEELPVRILFRDIQQTRVVPEWPDHAKKKSGV